MDEVDRGLVPAWASWLWYEGAGHTCEPCKENWTCQDKADTIPAHPSSQSRRLDSNLQLVPRE